MCARRVTDGKQRGWMMSIGRAARVQLHKRRAEAGALNRPRI